MFVAREMKAAHPAKRPDGRPRKRRVQDKARGDPQLVDSLLAVFPTLCMVFLEAVADMTMTMTDMMDLKWLLLHRQLAHHPVTSGRHRMTFKLAFRFDDL